jgi:hypothetical protein
MDTTVNFSRQKLSSIFKSLSIAETAQKDFSYKGARISLISVPAGHTEFVQWSFGEIIFNVSGDITIKFPEKDVLRLATDQSVKIGNKERSAIIEATTDVTILILEIKPEKNNTEKLNPWKM